MTSCIGTKMYAGLCRRSPLSFIVLYVEKLLMRLINLCAPIGTWVRLAPRDPIACLKCGQLFKISLWLCSFLPEKDLYESISSIVLCLPLTLITRARSPLQTPRLPPPSLPPHLACFQMASCVRWSALLPLPVYSIPFRQLCTTDA